MPILDIQVKVENNKIIYKFFKKPVSSPLLMLERSAMPTRIKRNISITGRSGDLQTVNYMEKARWMELQKLTRN